MSIREKFEGEGATMKLPRRYARSSLILIFFFAVPFSQLVNYDLIIFGLLRTFALVAGFNHLAAPILDWAHLDFVRRADHNCPLAVMARFFLP
jgi:hypothetical protein